MKTILTFLFGAALTFGSLTVQAQDLAAQAKNQTDAMAADLKLSDADYKKLKALNFNRLAQISSLATLREQDSRYLDIRLDIIEEEYHSKLFNLLNSKQYNALMASRKDQPYTYAGVLATMQNPTNQNARTIAISSEE